MNREALALRNQSMAEAFHQSPLKHQLRRRLLRLASGFSIPPSTRTNTERILLIRPDHLGDVLLSIPAVRALRQARPYAEIHVLVGPWSADVPAAFWEIDQVLTLPFPGFSRSPKTSWRSPYELAANTARRLRRIGYGSAVILRPDHWWGALTANLAGIPVRVGYDHPDVAPFLTEPAQPRRDHAVIQNLRLVERWTGGIDPRRVALTFPIDAADQAYVDGYLDEWGVKGAARVFCIHPGAGTEVKRWHDERWASVVDTLAEQLDARPVLTGTANELPLVQRVASLMQQQPIIMAGDTSVGQLAALFQRSTVVLGPDSGPLHLAVAVGTPTVALFGPADPDEFGPWGLPERHRVLTSDIACRPCRILDWESDDPANHPCVRDITVARVLDAARRAIATPPPD